MIDARELRIGNWVLLGKNYQPVYQILYDIGKGHSINHMDYEEELFQPIPLTTEILEKCGFTKVKGAHDSHIELDNFFLQKLSKGCIYKAYHRDVFVGSLHQLQNLYFALTNSELEINLNQ